MLRTSRPMPHNTERILGLDPGFARTGFAILQMVHAQPQAVAYGCIETKAGESYASRLLQLERHVKALLTKYRPTIAALEQLFYSNNAKTAFAVGQARGVLLLTLARKGIPNVEFTPQQVKIAATGYGNAKKQQVQRMVQVILGLPKPPSPDDAADALAVALAAAHRRRMNTHDS